MKKMLCVALVAAFALAVPAAASADEPLVCKVVNNYGEKLTGDPIMYCIDDPQPSPLELPPVSSGAAVQPDSIACTLERKGIYHSPLGSACGDDPWG